MHAVAEDARVCFERLEGLIVLQVERAEDSVARETHELVSLRVVRPEAAQEGNLRARRRRRRREVTPDAELYHLPPRDGFEVPGDQADDDVFPLRERL